MRKIIKYILHRFQFIRLKKYALFNGSNYAFLIRSSISLRHKASKEQVEFGDNVNFYGKIIIHGAQGRIKIGNYVHIGDYTQLQCVNSIILEDYATIGENVIVTDNNTHPTDPYLRKEMGRTPSGHFLRSYVHSENKPIYIGENVWIGSNARICKGVTIGRNSIVAANSVVTKDVPEDCIVAGNPAKVVKADYYKQ